MKWKIFKAWMYIVMLVVFAPVLQAWEMACPDGYYEISVPSSEHRSDVMPDKPMANSETCRLIGNQLILNRGIYIPKGYGASNRRLILALFVIDSQTEDTVKILDPIVLDGEKYKCKLKKDPYASYAYKKLTDGAFFLKCRESVEIPDPMKTYKVSCELVIQKKSKDIRKESFEFRSQRTFQFLEFPGAYELESDEFYKERPRREIFEKSFPLTFLVNKAELDVSDPNNAEHVGKLKGIIEETVSGGESMLIGLKITGVASPEGGCRRNLQLVNLRTTQAMKQIQSMIPDKQKENMSFGPAETRVATWEEVADMLEKDALLNEAAEVRAIVAKHTSLDDQYAAIRKLPCYQTAIKNCLSKLCVIQCGYRYFHVLSPEEILDRYYNDPEYQEGKKAFDRYEYLQLFEQIKDLKETERLCRRAYKETMAYDKKNRPKPWVLAANNLAVALLKRDTFDVEILKPFVDYTRMVNACDRLDEGGVPVKMPVNPEDVVANQLLMCLRANKFKDAGILMDMLPDTEKFKLLKAFTQCMMGNYDYRSVAGKERKEREEIFDLVKNSTPMNYVVMCMAMDADYLNEEALEALDKLPVTTQTKYMKLQLLIRMNERHDAPRFVKPFSKEDKVYMKACKMLDEIIKEDPKFRDIAESDGALSKEFMEYFNDPVNWRDE